MEEGADPGVKTVFCDVSGIPATLFDTNKLASICGADAAVFSHGRRVRLELSAIVATT